METMEKAAGKMLLDVLGLECSKMSGLDVRYLMLRLM